MYRVRVADQRRERTRDEIQVVTAATNRGDEWQVNIGEPSSRGVRVTQQWSVSSAGLFRIRNCDDEVPEEREQFLPAELKLGTTWVDEKNYPLNRVVYRVGSWQAVNVPAGSFHALRLDVVQSPRDVSERSETLRVSIWIVPGVGFVRTVAAGYCGFSYMRELVSFTPGR